jgi:hypothetical protein
MTIIATAIQLFSLHFMTKVKGYLGNDVKLISEAGVSGGRFKRASLGDRCLY